MPVLGIDVGGTNVRAMVADEQGQVLSFREAKTPLGSVDSLLSLIADMAGEARSCVRGNVRAAGVGFPGLIDFKRGVVRCSPNLPEFHDVAFAAMLSERLGVRVFLGNDVNIAALGERWLGAGMRFEDFAFITLGTGLGSGLIVNGRSFWGGTGYAAELGHLVVEPDGARCACGNVGCLEAYCSANGLRSRAAALRDSGEESAMWSMVDNDFRLSTFDFRLTPQIVDLAASRGDALAIKLLSDAARYLGIAIAALCDLVGIRVAIVGGRMANMEFDILGAAQAEANRRSICARAGDISEISVIRSSLGDKAGCLGAIRYAMDSLSG